MGGEFISTNIRYRNGMVKVESGDSGGSGDNKGGGETVSDYSMNIGSGGGGENGADNVNLYETLGMIDEGARDSIYSEAEPESENSSTTNKVRFAIEDEGSIVNVNTEIVGGDTNSEGDVVPNSANATNNDDSEGGGGVINIDSGIERDKDKDSGCTRDVDGASGGGDTGDGVLANSGESVGTIGGNSNISASKSECGGDVVEAIPRVPRTRLREIFQHAEGEFINYYLICFVVYRWRKVWYVLGILLPSS